MISRRMKIIWRTPPSHTIPKFPCLNLPSQLKENMASIVNDVKRKFPPARNIQMNFSKRKMSFVLHLVNYNIINSIIIMKMIPSALIIINLLIE